MSHMEAGTLPKNKKILQKNINMPLIFMELLYLLSYFHVHYTSLNLDTTILVSCVKNNQ